jgi:hypothetical protein
LSTKAQESSPAKAVLLYLMAGLAAVGAIYLLDANDAPQGANANFLPLSDDSAAKLGMSTAEQEAFNSELPMINAVKEECLLRAERELTDSGSHELSVGQASSAIRQQWQAIAPGALSIEAIAAVEKIGRGIE